MARRRPADLPPPVPQASEPSGADAAAHSPAPGRLLALGDSITVGEGVAMPGLPCRPWVSWLAAELGLSLCNLAANGALVHDLRHRQLPLAQGRFELACLYIGVNDVRGMDFELDDFATALDAAALALRRRSERLLLVTVPLDLGRPRAGAKVLRANAAIRHVAGAHGATVVSNEGRRGWQQVLPDAVHLTALGQRTLAADARSALAADGLWTPVSRPSVDALSAPEALRYAFTGHAPAVWRDLRRRAREGTLWAR